MLRSHPANPMVNPSRALSVTINRSAQDVYDFAATPENLPQWASGLGKSFKQVAGAWIAETAEGSVKVRFSERNTYGVLDHWVSPAPDVEIYIPMRVVPNGSGCELLFTLFHLPGMSNEQFAADAEWVMRDLTALKNVLEGQA